MKPKPVPAHNLNMLKKYILPEKREKTLNELRKVFKKWNTINYLIYLQINIPSIFCQKE